MQGYLRLRSKSPAEGTDPARGHIAISGRSVGVAGVIQSPDAQARELHLELVEVLKLLNRVEEEHGTVDGFETEEILHLLPKVGFPYASLEDVGRALHVLVANGLARTLTDQEYAWDRGRVVGERFVITLEGKQLLLKEIERVNRV
jgi:hypothetical protein